MLSLAKEPGIGCEDSMHWMIRNLLIKVPYTNKQEEDSIGLKQCVIRITQVLSTSRVID